MRTDIIVQRSRQHAPGELEHRRRRAQTFSRTNRARACFFHLTTMSTTTRRILRMLLVNGGFVKAPVQAYACV
jgi:hypothetical protein